MRYLLLVLYYLVFQYLPKSTTPFVGIIFRKVRAFIGGLIFESTGRSINIENRAYFGSGFRIKIGDYSGIGKRCRVPSNIIIGKNVMMAEEVIILNQNHNFSDISKPMIMQGYGLRSTLEIGDDTWIGTRVIILPNVKKIGSGVIIGAGSVVTKNIPDYAIVAGNPARIIKNRTG